MSMVSPALQSASNGGERLKKVVSLALVVAGLVLFYFLSSQALWLRLLSLLACAVVAVALFAATNSGRDLVAFARESFREAQRVTWPARKEVIQTTVAVFGFVLVMAILLWFTDKALEYVLYGLILGWRG